MSEREERLSTSVLLWGILWRSVVWHAGIGAGLGGLYGCSFIAVVMLASGTDTGAWIWAGRTMVMLGGLAGTIVGWRMARASGRRVEPLLGATVGLLVGVPAGGFYLVPIYILAFGIGAVFGVVYGLAVGLVNTVTVAVLTRARFPKVFDADAYRRAVARVSVPGMLVVPLGWALWSSGATMETGSVGPTGALLFPALVFGIFPALILVPATRWVGSRLAGWYADASDPTEGPSTLDARANMEPVRKARQTGGGS